MSAFLLVMNCLCVPCVVCCYVLLSHGFFVFAITHSDRSSPVTILPKTGEILKWEYLGRQREGDYETKMKYTKELWYRFSELQTLMDAIYASNNRSVVSNATTPFFSPIPDQCNFVGRMALEKKLGILGHSMGGVSALFTAQNDAKDRIAAVATLDPWLWPLQPVS